MIKLKNAVEINKNKRNLKPCTVALLFVCCMAAFFSGCRSENSIQGYWDFEGFSEEEPSHYTLKVSKTNEGYSAKILSYELGKIPLKEVIVSQNKMTANFEMEGVLCSLTGTFNGDEFNGLMQLDDESVSIMGKRQPDDPVEIDRSKVKYTLGNNDLQETELNIDHAGIIEELDEGAYARGGQIYNANCINCHGNPDLEGSLPNALKFWEQPFKSGGDPFSMYQTITRGFGAMPPQLKMTAQEKYDVITYIREAFVSENETEYFEVSPGYLNGLPKGSSRGIESKSHHPWSDQDYGNFFINTYELVDEETGIERYHSPGPVPFVDEDYSKNNFAYKGIAMRLDKGAGGVAKGKAWMIFDHDVMRVAGGWTGDGFIDWDGILLNDRHETYPRTVGKLHFETPVGPGWANPKNGSFDDPRFKARDGRQFGPLPKEWANYKGLYQYEGEVVISYTIGNAHVLEKLGREGVNGQIVFTRTLNISSSSDILKLRVAPTKNTVEVIGSGATLNEEDGYVVMEVAKSTPVKVKLLIADGTITDLESIVNATALPESLSKYTKGGSSQYPEILSSLVIKGSDDGIFAVDQLSPPYDNPWKCRMKLSGIDFMDDGNKAAVCTTDGDVFLVTGLTSGSGMLKWQRIGVGLFQPLGLKIRNDKIYVICRDQLVLLRDFNGDNETDYYESFNHDHQVTDHFHEFAMGLQTDDKGNFYYAKSGRHAREALIPQHGTLIKVSKDGSKSEIIASGFRAANGVCINPDGGFLVTDQQGYWNPMNRINWIEAGGESKFYGNMWGYNPPKDTTRSAMEPPMVWVDMEYDRSPSELLWVDSKKWGPLDGGLLSFSYGYGKIQLVLYEEVNGVKQGGVIDIPGMKFYTGVMRGRFHPEDQHLYLCGMEAWSTSQNMRTGDLYRVRYTGNTITMPVQLNAKKSGMTLGFSSQLQVPSATKLSNYEVKTWDLVRSSHYGSERYNVKNLKITDVKLTKDGTAVHLFLQDIEPVDVMTISYNIYDEDGTQLKGTIQNTIHSLDQSVDHELTMN